MIDVGVLRAAGLTDAQIVCVFEAHQKREAEKALVTRARKARNKRDQRAREQAMNDVTDVTDVTGDAGDTGDASISSLTESNLESKKEKKERKQPATIPSDWQPSPRTIAVALGYGFTESQILETAEDLRLWAQSNAHRPVARKSDWDATLLTWLRKKRKERDEADRNRKPDMADTLGRLKDAEESLRRGDGGIYQAWPPTLRIVSEGGG
jgi:hypothetical protein